MSRQLKPIVPLTKEQHKEVETLYVYVMNMANNIWRWSRLPARYLEELRSEAGYYLCWIISTCDRSKLDPARGITLNSKAVLTVKGRLLQKVRKYRKDIVAADLDNGYLLMELEPAKNDNRGDKFLANKVTDCVNRLEDEFQRMVITTRFGLVDRVPKTVDETAKAIQISGRAVIYQTKRAFDSIREVFEKEMNNVAS